MLIDTFEESAPAPRTEFHVQEGAREHTAAPRAPEDQTGPERMVHAVMAALRDFPEAFRAAVEALRMVHAQLEQQPGVP